MNREQFLLLKLIEELGEAAKNAAKAMQFGGSDKEPGQPYSNFERLSAELNDVSAAIVMLNNEPTSEFTHNPDSRSIEAKRQKVEHYYAVSQQLGKVQ